MLSYLQFYEDFWGPLRLFNLYPSEQSVRGNCLDFWFLSRPKLIHFLRAFGARQAFRDKDEVGDLADLHQAKERLPTMGGLLICLTVTFAVILWAEPNVYVIAALVTYLLLTLVGFGDDYLKISRKNSKGLPGRYKLVGQFIATGAALYVLMGPLSEILTGGGRKSSW